MKKLLKVRKSLTVICGVIAVSMLVLLIFAIREGSKEEIIGSAVVLGLSLIALLLAFIFPSN